MPNFLCTTCGTQYADSPAPPDACPICTDPRQYIKPAGQQWTTHDYLRHAHKNTLRHEEPGLVSLGMEPHFAIGQRAFFVRTPGGNVLWDCLPLIDPALAEAITALGGIHAIAISHPHYYSSMVEWSRALGGVPIYLHAADREWVMRLDPAIVFWDAPTHPLTAGLTLVAHFFPVTQLAIAALHVVIGAHVVRRGASQERDHLEELRQTQRRLDYLAQLRHGQVRCVPLQTPPTLLCLFRILVDCKQTLHGVGEVTQRAQFRQILQHRRY